MADHPSSGTPPDRSALGQGYGRLAGKNALVTGSTRGLGRTIAEWLAREGANIVVSGRSQDDVDTTAAEIRDLGVTTWGIAADLADLEDTTRLVEQTLAAVDHLDILVNNAGMSLRGNFWEVTAAEWDHQINVNLRSPFVLSQAAAAHMIERRLPGRIVNISTIGVFRAHADGMVYNIAKSGIQTMTRNMSHELGPHQISVNCVAPGAVGDRPGNAEDFPPDKIRSLHNKIPYGRIGRAEDIAAAVRFFCLPESEWTTGQTLLVDGAHIAAFDE